MHITHSFKEIQGTVIQSNKQNALIYAAIKKFMRGFDDSCRLQNMIIREGRGPLCGNVMNVALGDKDRKRAFSVEKITLGVGSFIFEGARPWYR